jgi:hypothetical protein
VLQAISDLPVAAALRGSAIAYPLVNAVHIAGFGALLGAILTLDLRLLGAFRSQPLGALAPPLQRVAAGGLAVAALTGLLLFSTRAPAYAENPAFLLKLGLLAAGLLNVVALRLSPHWARALDGGEVHPSVRLAAALSLLAWLGAVLAGRWIGFLQ